MNILNQVLDYAKQGVDFIGNQLSFVGEVDPTKISGKTYARIMFYATSLVFPILAYLVLGDLKGYTLLLISYSCFVQYLNVCISEKYCFAKKNNCKFNEHDTREALSIGFISFIVLWFFIEINKRKRK